MNFDDYLSKTLIKEEFYIDMNWKNLDHLLMTNDAPVAYNKHIPVAVNPTKPEFIKIAKDSRSAYYLDNRLFHGVRIGVINFWQKDSVPDIYVWPGSLFHISIYIHLRNEKIISYKSPFNCDHAWDFYLSWDDSQPNTIFTEYLDDVEFLNLQNKSAGGDLYYKKFQKMFERLFPIQHIKLQSTLENVLVFPKTQTVDNGIESSDLNEPKYASSIRDFHSEY